MKLPNVISRLQDAFGSEIIEFVFYETINICYAFILRFQSHLSLVKSSRTDTRHFPKLGHGQNANSPWKLVIVYAILKFCDIIISKITRYRKTITNAVALNRSNLTKSRPISSSQWIKRWLSWSF